MAGSDRIFMTHPDIHGSVGKNEDPPDPGETTREAFDGVWEGKGWVLTDEKGTPLSKAAAKAGSTDSTGA